MLKKFLIMLCLCFMPFTSALAETVIIGHAYYYNWNSSESVTLWYKQKDGYITTSKNNPDLTNGKVHFFEVDNNATALPFTGFINKDNKFPASTTYSCDCHGCMGYRHSLHQDKLHDVAWSWDIEEAKAKLVNDVSWLYGTEEMIKKQGKKYYNVRVDEGKELASQAGNREYVWNVIADTDDPVVEEPIVEHNPKTVIIGHAYCFDSNWSKEIGIYDKNTKFGTDKATLAEVAGKYKMAFYELNEDDFGKSSVGITGKVNTCSCCGCQYVSMETYRKNNLWKKEWSIDFPGIYDKMIEMLEEKYKGVYTNIRCQSAKELACVNHVKHYAWDIVGDIGSVVSKDYTVTIRDIIGEGTVKVDGELLRERQSKSIEAGKLVDIECIPAEGWRLADVVDNEVPGVHRIDWGNVYKVFATQNHTIDVKFEEVRTTTYTIELEYDSNQGLAYISKESENITDNNLTWREESIKEGERRYIHIKPKEGYEFKRAIDINVDTGETTEDAHIYHEYSYPMNIYSNRKVKLEFEKKTGEYTLELEYDPKQGTVYISEDKNKITDFDLTKKEEHLEKGAVRYIHIRPGGLYGVYSFKQLDDINVDTGKIKENAYNRFGPGVSYNPSYHMVIESNRKIKVEFSPGPPSGASGEECYSIDLDYDSSKGTAYISDNSNNVSDTAKTNWDLDIKKGSDRYIHIVPNEGYSIDKVIDSDTSGKKDLSIEGVSYPIKNIAANHIVSIDFDGGLPPTAGEYNIKITYATPGGTACISEINTLSSSTGITSENVTKGSKRYIYFYPQEGYKLLRVDDTGVVDAHEYLDMYYETGEINSDREITVYFNKETVPPTIVDPDGDPYTHEITTLDVVNPSKVSEPVIYEAGSNLGLKTNVAHTDKIELSTLESILSDEKEKSFSGIGITNGASYNPSVVLSETGDYDESIGEVGINKVNITASYPDGIHKALQTIYISPNWYIKRDSGMGSSSGVGPTGIKSNSYDSALKVVSTRDLRWQSIFNSYSPKWGLSTANGTSKPLFPNGATDSSGRQISPIKTGYAVEFTFDITDKFKSYSSTNPHNVQIDVSYKLNGSDLNNNRLYYRNTYGGTPIQLESDYKSFNLNDTDDIKRFNITEKGNQYRFMYYLPGTLCIKKADGNIYTPVDGDKLDIYFTITVKRGGTSYFVYNELTKKKYNGWNGWVFSYDLTKSNLQDVGSNTN